MREPAAYAFELQVQRGVERGSVLSFQESPAEGERGVRLASARE